MNIKPSKNKLMGLLLHKVFNSMSLQSSMRSLPCINVYVICTVPKVASTSTTFNSGCATFQSDFVSLIEHQVSVLSVIGDIRCINLHCYHLQIVVGQWQQQQFTASSNLVHFVQNFLQKIASLLLQLKGSKKVASVNGSSGEQLVTGQCKWWQQ